MKTIEIIFIILGTLASLSIIGVLVWDWRRGHLSKGGLVTKYSMVVKWSDNDACFFAYSPELPGLLTDGPTRSQATTMFEEAVEGHLAVLKEMTDPLPEPQLFEQGG